MKLSQIGPIVVATAGLLIAFQNCAKQGAIDSGPTTAAADSVQMRKALADLEGQITDLSGRDLSCVSDADCTLTPVGRGNCGLPTFQVVNSVRNAERPRILALATQFKDVERNYLSSNQLVSTCGGREYAPPVCRQNICVIPDGR